MAVIGHGTIDNPLRHPRALSTEHDPIKQYLLRTVPFPTTVARKHSILPGRRYELEACMPVAPFDRLAKTAWRQLLDPYRRCEVQRSIDLAPLFADFWVWPGPPLPEWMGVFGKMVGTALVVGESETGQLTWRELRMALLKVAMGEEQANKAFSEASEKIIELTNN